MKQHKLVMREDEAKMLICMTKAVAAVCMAATVQSEGKEKESEELFQICREQSQEFMKMPKELHTRMANKLLAFDKEVYGG